MDLGTSGFQNYFAFLSPSFPPGESPPWPLHLYQEEPSSSEYNFPGKELCLYFCYFISPCWKKPEYVSQLVRWKWSQRGLFFSLENACKGTSRDCELVDIWSEWLFSWTCGDHLLWQDFFFLFSSKEFCSRNISPACWSLYQDCFQLGVLCQAFGEKGSSRDASQGRKQEIPTRVHPVWLTGKTCSSFSQIRIRTKVAYHVVSMTWWRASF